MFWKRKTDDPCAAFIERQNREDAEQRAEYAKAISIEGVKPSIEGNKVIFYAPELVTLYGSTGLDRNYKWFKNDKGQLYRKEIFETTWLCKLT
jgi:hypothetical protein